LAEEETIVITRHGKPAGLLVGFASEDDGFDYRLAHDVLPLPPQKPIVSPCLICYTD
jgi:hypothetical protein